jgi:hypothetical protein
MGVLFSLWLQTDYSSFLWNAIKPMEFFQYPWRFMIFTFFFLSIIGGSMIIIIQKIIQQKYIIILFGIVIIGSIVFFQIKFFVPEKYFNVDANYYVNRPALLWQTSKTSDEYMPKNFIKPTSEKQALQYALFSTKDLLNINVLSNSTQNKSLLVMTKKQTPILFKTAYFPAWKLFIDGKDATYIITNYGMVATLPEGTHVITFHFGQTTLEKVSNLLSLSGIMILFIGIIITLHKKSTHEKNNC